MFTSQCSSLELPIGTILPYVGNLADIPDRWHLCDGTNGTPNLLDNRFLEGDATPGIFKEPGLPNIIYTQRHAGGNNDYTQGALSITGWGGGYSNGVMPWSATYFDAESGRKYWHQQTYGTTPTDTIFGNSTTVQPKAYTVMYIIKVK